MNRKNILLLISLCYLYLISAPVIASNQIPVNSVDKALIYYGGGKKLKGGDEHVLAEYDMLLLDRFRYNQIVRDTWNLIRKYNKNIEIYLYQVGPEVAKSHDKYKKLFLNDIGRYKVSRGHSMGSVFDHEGFFLKNKFNKKIRVSTGNEYYLLDFGNEEFQKYWSEATISDLHDQPWTADGVNVDNCLTFSESFVKNLLGANSDKYKIERKWNTSMNNYVNAITGELHSVNQKVLVNRGNTRIESGYMAWLELDSYENPPDIVYEEGAFAVNWGRGDVQFFSEREWLRQVTLPGKIKNSNVIYQSHTDLNIGETGYDSWGNSVGFNQILEYSLGSYLLSKPESSTKFYFAFDGDRDNGDYRNLWWFDIYDNLKLGQPLGVMSKVSSSSANIYRRNYSSGLVYVNPTSNDVVINYPDGYSLVNLAKSKILQDGRIEIKSHHALIFKSME